MMNATLDGTAIPHEVHGRFGTARVVLVLAVPELELLLDRQLVRYVKRVAYTTFR